MELERIKNTSPRVKRELALGKCCIITPTPTGVLYNQEVFFGKYNSQKKNLFSASK